MRSRSSSTLSGVGASVSISRRASSCARVLKKHRVLIGHDRLVDAALGKRARGDELALIRLDQRHHAVRETVGEDGTFHIVVFEDAVVAAGGVHHPVADIDQIEQTAELLFRQFNIHCDDPLCRKKICIAEIIARPLFFCYSKNREKRKKSGGCLFLLLHRSMMAKTIENRRDYEKKRMVHRARRAAI